MSDLTCKWYLSISRDCFQCFICQWIWECCGHLVVQGQGGCASCSCWHPPGTGEGVALLLGQGMCKHDCCSSFRKWVCCRTSLGDADLVQYFCFLEKMTGGWPEESHRTGNPRDRVETQSLGQDTPPENHMDSNVEGEVERKPLVCVFVCIHPTWLELTLSARVCVPLYRLTLPALSNILPPDAHVFPVPPKSKLWGCPPCPPTAPLHPSVWNPSQPSS